MALVFHFFSLVGKKKLGEWWELGKLGGEGEDTGNGEGWGWF